MKSRVDPFLWEGKQIRQTQPRGVEQITFTYPFQGPLCTRKVQTVQQFEWPNFVETSEEWNLHKEGSEALPDYGNVSAVSCQN